MIRVFSLFTHLIITPISNNPIPIPRTISLSYAQKLNVINNPPKIKNNAEKPNNQIIAMIFARRRIGMSKYNVSLVIPKS